MSGGNTPLPIGQRRLREPVRPDSRVGVRRDLYTRFQTPAARADVPTIH